MIHPKTNIIIIFIFLSVNFLFGQLSQPQRLLYLPQGYTLESLSGGANLVASQSSISNITAVNPAALTDIKGFNAGLSYQVYSDIPNAWAADIVMKKNDIYYPQAFGLAYGWNNFTFTVGSNQIYNGTVDYGEFKVAVRATNDSGYGGIHTVHTMRKEIVFRNSAVLSFNLKDVPDLPSDLSFGIQYNYNVLRSRLKNSSNFDLSEWNIGLPEFSKQITASNFIIGVRYALNSNVLKLFDLGIYYESQLEFEKYSENIRFFGSIPAKLHTGGRIGWHNGFIFSANISYYLWEEITESNELNQTEYVANLSYEINQSLTAAIGALITDRQYDISADPFNLNNSFFATYLTIGATYNYKNYQFDFTLADSHLFSDKWRKQTILKGGIGYSLM